MLRLLIAIVSVVLVVAYLRRRARQQNRAVAENIVGSLRRNFPRQVECRALSAGELPPHAMPHLEAAREAFERAGLTPLGDVAILSTRDANGDLVPIRNYVSAEEGIAAGAYFLPALESLTYDVTSELADGRVLTTTTGELAQKFDSPPEYRRHYLPKGTAFDVVMRTHRERLAAVHAEHPEVRLYAPASLDALIADIERHAARKHDFRRSVGWLTETEFKRHVPEDADPVRMDAIYAEIRKVLAEAA